MKNRVIFLPVPEIFRERFSHADTVFQIDPDIPIPAEIPAEIPQNYNECGLDDTDNLSLDGLSMEMILCGMLRVIEEGQVEQKWIDYYCSFILFLRPDILTKIREIKDSGLNDENYKKANSLIREGRAEEALVCIRSFIERYPLERNGWFILGWALRILGRFKDGEAAFRKAIELGGANCGAICEARNELAICLIESGDINGAQLELEKALKEDPQNVKIISNLGVLAAKNGQKEKAAAFFRAALEIDGNDPVARQYLNC
jgi:tetratricopeptide (TPR) repeat protein